MNRDENAPTVGVVRYGAGNVGNVIRALKKLDMRHALLEDPQSLAATQPSLLLLPGVGAFRPAAERLRRSGWSDALCDWVREERPLVGICVGMQLLCTSSDEDGRTDGLGFLTGSVARFAGIAKIPHMGWNDVVWTGDAPCYAREADACAFYFVHSYAVSESPHCVARTEVDGVSFCSAMRNGNVLGFQFHPERSGPEGIAFLGSILRGLLRTDDMTKERGTC